jgi:hypothetical protein
MKGILAIFKGGAESFLGAHQKKLWLVKQEEGSRRRGLLFRGVGGKEGSEAHTVRGDAIPREGMIGRSRCNIPLLLGQANFSGFEQACRWSLREKSSHAGPFNATTKTVVQTAVHAKKTRDLTMQLRLFRDMVAPRHGRSSPVPQIPKAVFVGLWCPFLQVLEHSIHQTSLNAHSAGWVFPDKRSGRLPTQMEPGSCQTSPIQHRTMALSNSREIVTCLPCLSEILLTVCLLVFQRLGKFIERTLSSVNQFYAVNVELIPQPKEPHQKMWEGSPPTCSSNL